MRFTKTLLFTGVVFWLGIALFAVSAYGLLAFDPPSPDMATDVPDALVPAVLLYGYVAYYGCRVFGVLGLVYVFVGWGRARRAAVTA
jgi:hypothetical protein